jgi:hypothetical protein
VNTDYLGSWGLIAWVLAVAAFGSYRVTVRFRMRGRRAMLWRRIAASFLGLAVVTLFVGLTLALVYR